MKVTKAWSLLYLLTQKTKTILTAWRRLGWLYRFKLLIKINYMAKLEIKAQGTTDECIDDLALVMLQHERIRNIVLGAAVKTLAIEALGHQAKADQIAEQMKEMIKGN